MAKITVEIQSRCLYIGEDERRVAELFELTGFCEYGDDWETGNDFDVNLRSDLYRYSADVNVDTSETSQSDQRATAINGTRTSATEFTRGSGEWTADGLRGYRAWIYKNTAPEAGQWHDVLSNTTTKITIESGSIVTDADRVQLQSRTQIRHLIQLTPKVDFYGSFFQYKVTKKLSSTDGKFKWFGVKGSAIPRNVDPEFMAGMVSNNIENGW